MSDTIAIIGRANVGKSTLFNRLNGARYAMVSSVPGTTRDLKESQIYWRGRKMNLIDTGGFLASEKHPLKKLTRREQKNINKNEDDNIDKQVIKQAHRALKRADVVIMVVDTKEGLNSQDLKIAEQLRKLGDKKIIVAANKCDNPEIRRQAAVFYKLGLGEPIPISATNSSGSGDLLDVIIKKIKDNRIEEKEENNKNIKICLIGRPNVGKSSLLNTLYGEEKAIVSPQPHTTREPNEAQIKYLDKKITIVDTAGIRKKAKIQKDDLENIGVDLSIKSLKKSDIALLIIDMSETLAKQDLQLGNLVAESGVSVIIVANKYDLAAKKNEQLETKNDNIDITSQYKKYIYSQFPHLSWAPIIFLSAKTALNTTKIIPLIVEIDNKKNKMVTEKELSKMLQNLINKQPPPQKKSGYGRRMRIERSYVNNIKQVAIDPPTFCCQCAGNGRLPESYLNYIMNNIRIHFDFQGIPLKIFIKK